MTTEDEKHKEIRATTVFTYFSGSRCDDCGKEGVSIVHWGPLVPKDEQGKFCPTCWTKRIEDWKQGKKPRPAMPLKYFSLKYYEEQKQKNKK
ncbi:MAG: hypothetical protein HQ536_00555 [Parcubacteria group bacterium]|nr:hypothetical protein [Parcubacteria group bacterium]